MSSGFEKWGKIPRGAQVADVMLDDAEGLHYLIQFVRPETMEKHTDTTCPLFSLAGEMLMVHAPEKYVRATVRYTTIHQKELKRPRRKHA